MCVDPATAFIATTLLSSGVQAFASIQQGNAAYQSGMYNAQIAEQNAQAVEDDRADAKDAAAIERRRLGEQARAQRGELVARFANMGLDTEFGTPADLVGDVERAYRIDRDIIGRNEITTLRGLDKQEADYRNSAALSRAEAKSSRKAGQLGALGSLLGGAASVSGRWIQPPAPRPVGVRATPLNPASTVKVGGY